jgi:hypothetical protein
MIPGMADVYDVEYITTVNVEYDIMKMIKQRYQKAQLCGSERSSSSKSISKFGSVVVATDMPVRVDTPVACLVSVFPPFDLIAWSPFASSSTTRIEILSSSAESVESESYSSEECECFLFRSAIGDSASVDAADSVLSKTSFSLTAVCSMVIVKQNDRGFCELRKGGPNLRERSVNERRV